ncbi:hypothetical protein [Nocardia sp. NPDC050718]|uniref:hypothetical protein n=1 Tax=Nocardia sp. NPDC050718 TaxID=3155788 RepID=UPI0033D476A1
MVEDAAAQNAVVAVEAKATGAGVVAASVAVRNYMSVAHLWSALRSARCCDEREQELVAAGIKNIDMGHRSDAINSVLSAVAFLEGFVNETLADSVQAPMVSYRTEGLDLSALERMREFWVTGVIPLERKMSVVQKFQLVLVCAGKPTLEAGRSPLQAVNALIELRNELVHFKPVTQDIEESHRMWKLLQARITPNRQSIGSPWYPNSALAAGCASWACESAMELVDDWQARLGLVHDYRDTLSGFEAP